MKLWCATTNQGKLREFRLSGMNVEVLPRMSDITPCPENGSTFEENAAAKAIYYSGFVNGAVFADDSGLVVNVLDGAPGVHSARYAGQRAGSVENNSLLLHQLSQKNDRRAKFVCVICVAREGELVATFRGEVDGLIVEEYRGTGGFGYDPLFLYPPAGRTFAEIPELEKFAISHRGKAMRAMAAWAVDA